MDSELLENLRTYIRTELVDADLYRQLAPMAPNEMEMNLIMEMAADEQSHADDFKLIYKDLTGEIYRPSIPAIHLNAPYSDILRDRVIDETGDFRKYMHEHQEYFQNEALREAFFNAAVDENVHAVRLLNFTNNPEQ
ncbi:ferritin-like domain-containing protein [Aminipila luticellarii]|uniref:Ferritin-like domain-containing protein n=1 Tax=Aminipila luticellarii TaxID=2507160 RepID=A0A410PX85_9FIRM|nr:ferritin-like domain-containing protein [Aminipila luticellarii]QAT43572.1 ferritin-like domain-containing protein [Aminipila luticellarii]